MDDFGYPTGNVSIDAAYVAGRASLQSELAATRHALGVARNEILKLQDDLLQGANREDQLRAELEESRKSGRWAAKEISGLRERNDELFKLPQDRRAELEEAKRSKEVIRAALSKRGDDFADEVIRLGADNEALRARLEHAEHLLRTAVASWSQRQIIDAFLSPGSSTRDACRCGSGAHPRRCAVHPERYAQHCAELSAEAEPAAPESSPANVPTFDQLVERVGPLPTTGLASAQGTTLHPFQNSRTGACMECGKAVGEHPDLAVLYIALDKRVSALGSRLLAHGKIWDAVEARVAALEAMQRKLDGDVALLMPQHAGLEPFERAADFEQTTQEASHELAADGVDVPKFLDRVLRTVGMSGGGGSGIGAPLSDLGNASPPQPAPVESLMCYDTACRYYGQRHATPHEAKETAPVERHGFVCGVHGGDCGRPGIQPVDCQCRFCGQPRSAEVHGEGGK